MTEPLRAISCRQPWAHAVIHMGKDIENRRYRTQHRGLTLIHASAGMTQDDFVSARLFMRRIGFNALQVPDWADLRRGGIIGAVDLLDCVTESDSRWWMGPVGYVLARPRPIPFIACTGTITPVFWVPPPEVRAAAAAALGLPA